MSFYVNKKVGQLDVDRATRIAKELGATIEQRSEGSLDIHLRGWRGPVHYKRGRIEFDTDVLPETAGFSDMIETKNNQTHEDIDAFMRQYTRATALDFAQVNGYEVQESVGIDGTIVLKLEKTEDLLLGQSSFE